MHSEGVEQDPSTEPQPRQTRNEDKGEGDRQPGAISTAYSIWLGVQCEVQSSSYQEGYDTAREWLVRVLRAAMTGEGADQSAADGIISTEPFDLVEAAIHTLQRMGQEKRAAREAVSDSNPPPVQAR